VGQGVAPRRSLIDDHDGYRELRGVPDEPVAGHHRQRGAEDHQNAGGLGQRVTLFHARPRHVLAEEHHIGLQHPAAVLAVHDLEALGLVVGDDRVAIGVDLGHACGPVRIRRAQPLVECFA
jgi:hypothetical protein